MNLKNLQLPAHLTHLYQHLLENRYLRPLNSINHDYLSIYSHVVLDEIQHKRPGWQDKVPAKVAQLIGDHHFFSNE